MKYIFHTGKSATLIFSVLLAISIIGLVSFSTSNKLKQNLLNSEILKNEIILSEKLLVDKQIQRYKRENQALKIKNKNLDTALLSAYKSFNKKDKEIRNLNADLNKIKQLEKNLHDLLKLNAYLNKKNDSLIIGSNLMVKGKNDLNKKNILLYNQINSLDNRIHDLLTVVADNYRIESKRLKTNSLTIKASKTNLIQFGFDIPENINSDIKFRIITPKGNMMSGIENGISHIIIDNPPNFTASTSPENDNVDRPKRIEMSFKPKGKLQVGIYKIEILNKDGIIGSSQFRLK